jgi:hypothetical protein
MAKTKPLEGFTAAQQKIINIMYRTSRPMTISEISTTGKIGWKTVKDNLEYLKIREIVKNEAQRRKEYWLLEVY